MADEMVARGPQRDRLLTPGEVATRHRRFRESEVRALLRGEEFASVPQQPTAGTVDLAARRLAR